MKLRAFIIGLVFNLALLLFAQRRPTVAVQPSSFRYVIDLTHVIDVPAHRELKNSSNNAFATKIDAPAQFRRGMWNVDQIPAERLIASLVVIDVRAEVKNNSDYQISVEDIARWERAHGDMPQNAIVVARTGWESRWKSADEYRNEDAKGVEHFPGYSADAAKFLVEARNVLGMGIDTPSVDFGPSKDLPIRDYTLAHSVYHLENVANLDRAPEKDGMVIVAPVKMAGLSSGPVRIMALAR